MPSSRTSIRNTQNHAERIHGDGRMAFKHNQSRIIEDNVFFVGGLLVNLRAEAQQETPHGIWVAETANAFQSGIAT